MKAKDKLFKNKDSNLVLRPLTSLQTDVSLMEGDVTVNLLFFAKSRELVGSGSGELVLTASTNFETLKQALLLKYPSLQVIAENIILSLNEEYIDDSQQLTLREGDEVAVIPPISGG